MVDLNIAIGGAAGQGLQKTGFLLGKALVRSGNYAFAVQDSMSRIRGGHNVFSLRISENRIAAMTGQLDVLIALNKETIDLDAPALKKNGLLIADLESLKFTSGDPRIIGVPLKRLAVEQGGQPLLANTVALGAVLGLADCGAAELKKLFDDNFSNKEMARQNLAAAEAGFVYARSHFAGRLPRLVPQPHSARMFLTGNEAICLGAIAAGVKFMSAYPMSPSTSIITYLAGVEDRVGLVTEQAEDEIAAINLAFGASMAGVRAMTATSGGGLSLMIETISLLGVSEVPLVIVDCQRPGPATGLPTRTEQGDLLFVIHAGHGEFARAVLAPGNAEEAFYDTIRAFNLADRFQIPVIILAEQHLSESYYTVDSLDLDRIARETSLLTGDELAALQEYKRYELTPSGVSGRAYPGQSNHLVLTDSHEHNEHGHITEDAKTRQEMVNKRLRKKEQLRAALSGPRLFGSAESKVIILGWGSTLEVLRESVKRLQEAQIDVSLLHFGDLEPFPKEQTATLLKRCPRLIAVEGNATHQLAQLVSQHTGRLDIETVSRFDGRPFLADELYSELAAKVMS